MSDTWDEAGTTLVRTTVIPTFAVMMAYGYGGDPNFETVYFSQDEKADEDNENFRRMGFAYVDELVWGPSELCEGHYA